MELQLGQWVWLKPARTLGRVVAIGKKYYRVKQLSRFTSEWPREDVLDYLEPVIMSFAGPVFTRGGNACVLPSRSLSLLCSPPLPAAKPTSRRTAP